MPASTAYKVLRPDTYVRVYPASTMAIPEWINTLSIRIYDLAYVDLEDGYWQGQRSFDSHCRIFYTMDRDIRLYCNDTEWILEPGVFYLFPSQMAYTLPTTAAGKLYLQHLRISIWSGIDLWYVTTPQVLVLRAPERQYSERFMDFCRSRVEGQDRELALLAFTYTLFAAFVASNPLTLPDQTVDRIEKIQRALRMIVRNPERRYSVTELARSCAMSREGFSREFKQVVGIAPSRYQLEQRLMQIQQLLLQKDDTLAELARRFGFSSAYHLSRAFLRYAGVSPKEFRRRHELVFGTNLKLP